MSVQDIQRAKDECLALGISLLGPCGALEITNRAAATHGWKLIEKTSGDNCRARKSDGLIVDGVAIDCLVNAGGTNGPDGTPMLGTGNVPAWQVMGPQNALVAKDPFPIAAVPGPPVVPPVIPPVEPPAPGGSLAEMQWQVAVLTQTVDRLVERVELLHTVIEHVALVQARGLSGTVGGYLKLTVLPIAPT